MEASPTMPTEKVTGDATVLEVGEGRRPWSSTKGGEFIGYRVKLRLASGVEVGNVEINTKADSPKFVEVGEQLFGVFDPRVGNQYGPRFQKQNPQGGGGGGGGRGKSPMEQARIQRQHSQEMAIRFATAAGWLDGIPHDDGERIVALVGASEAPLKKLIDLFDQDIERGAKAAVERRQQSGSQ